MAILFSHFVQFYLLQPTLDFRAPEQLLRPFGGNGFMTEHFIRPPVELKITFKIPVVIEKLCIAVALGSHCCRTVRGVAEFTRRRRKMTIFAVDLAAPRQDPIVFDGDDKNGNLFYLFY